MLVSVLGCTSEAARRLRKCAPTQDGACDGHQGTHAGRLTIRKETDKTTPVDGVNGVAWRS
jgi:hypothetical protein